MNSTEKIPPCPENGQEDEADTTCPSWCAREHLRDDQPDHHHDSARWLLTPAGHAAQSGDRPLSVHVAQFVPQDGRPWAPVVELGLEGQRPWRLTPQEAGQVALALLRAAQPVLPDRVVSDSLQDLSGADMLLALLHNAAGLAATLEAWEAGR